MKQINNKFTTLIFEFPEDTTLCDDLMDKRQFYGYSYDQNDDFGEGVFLDVS